VNYELRNQQMIANNLLRASSGIEKKQRVQTANPQKQQARKAFMQQVQILQSNK